MQVMLDLLNRNSFSSCFGLCCRDTRICCSRGAYNKYAGKMADIWSCGILLYCMLTGCFPFRRKEDEGLETQAVLQKMLPRILKADFQKPQVLYHIHVFIREHRNILLHCLLASCPRRPVST